jgi:hypothetical protein
MRHLILCLIFLLIFSGCTPAPYTPETITLRPDIMPRLDPSPTPSGSMLPLNCQVTDLKVYISKVDGYCFAYPVRFALLDQPADRLGVIGPAVDDSLEPIHATLTVEVSPTTNGYTLHEQAEFYLKGFSVVDSTTFTWKQIQVGGEPAWLVEPIPVMLSYRIVFVQHNENVYRLLYWPVDVPEAKADLDDLTQTTLGSFTFTK